MHVRKGIATFDTIEETYNMDPPLSLYQKKHRESFCGGCVVVELFRVENCLLLENELAAAKKSWKSH
jgi:hypothetical protein